MPKDPKETAIPAPRKKPAGLKQNFAVTSSFTLADLSAKEFETFLTSDNLDEIYSNMKFEEQTILMLLIIGRGREATKDCTVQYFMDEAKVKGFPTKALSNVLFYMKPSEVLAKRRELAFTLFPPRVNEASEILYSEELPPDLMDSQEETMPFLENLPKKAVMNPKLAEAKAKNTKPSVLETKEREVFWKNAEIRFPEWFEDPEEMGEVLKQIKLPFAKNQGQVKHLFECWLLGEKGYSPEELYDGKYLSEEAKKALGAQFLEDLKAHPAFGATEQGEEKIKEGIRWFGGLYSKAAINIAGRNISFPPYRWNRAETVEQSLRSEFGYAARFAGDMNNVVDNVWGDVCNQQNEYNNYGLSYRDEFEKGYDPEFEKTLYGFRKLAAVDDLRREIVGLGVENSIAPGISATYVAGIAKIMKALSGHKVFEPEEEGLTEDIEAMIGRMKDRAARLKDGAEVQGPNAEKYRKAMDGGYKAKDPQYAGITACLQFTEEDYDKALEESHYNMVNNALHVINTNHKEELFTLGYVRDADALSEPSISLLSQEDLRKAEEIFDRIYKPLRDAEKPIMKRLGLSDEEFLKGFALGEEGDTVMEVMKERYIAMSKPGQPVAPKDQKKLNQYTKAYILHAMVVPLHDLTYRSDKPTQAREYDEFDIHMVKKTVKVDYDQLDGLGKELQDLVSDSARFGRIDAWYHHNSREFKGVRDALAVLSERFAEISSKREENPKYLQNMPKEDWDRLKEQLDRTMTAIGTYETARQGTKNKISIRRLNALAPLKTIISKKMEVQDTVEKRNEPKAVAPKK
ncbi:MAG: hypothetical protein K6E92_04445 [Lachnospiraceae bacterium]|nr:hypothetical protein [Lachnospiraceae bacterium]